MKSSNLLLGAWLVVVALITFGAAYFLIQRDDGDGPPDDGDTVVLPGDGTDGATTDGNGTPPVRVKPTNTGAVRVRPRIRGRVLDGEGQGVAGADLALARPVNVAPPEETVEEDDLHKVYALLVLDNDEFDLPRRMDAYAETLKNKAEATSEGAQEIVSAVSGAGGSFDFEIPRGSGTGPFRLTAQKDGVGKASAQGVGPGANIELTLGQPMQVKGTVISGGNSTPVSGAIVVLDDGESRFSGRADEEGEFLIEGVAPGRYTVDVAARGFPSIIEQSVEVRQDGPLALRLPRGATLRVIAMLDDDFGERPLPRVEVVAMEMDSYTYVTGTTNGNGVVEFSNMPPGQYLINGRSKEAISFSEEIRAITPEELLVEQQVDFEPAIPKPVEVVDPSGNPVAGVVFYSANVDEEYDSLRSEKLPGESDTRGIYNFAFEFDGTRAMIFGFKKGYSIIRVYPEDHDTPTAYRVTAMPSVRVYGTVRSEDGTPVPDALVLIECEPAEEYDADGEGEYIANLRSGPDGTYDFPFTPKGEILVSAELGDIGWSDDVEIEIVEGKDEYKADLVMELD